MSNNRNIDTVTEGDYGGLIADLKEVSLFIFEGVAFLALAIVACAFVIVI